jgi:hypothetical protein
MFLTYSGVFLYSLRVSFGVTGFWVVRIGSAGNAWNPSLIHTAIG